MASEDSGKPPCFLYLFSVQKGYLIVLPCLTWSLGFQNYEPNPKNSTKLQGSKCFELSSFMYVSLGLTTGADTVLLQSGTSTPSLSCFSGMAVISDVEREWVNLEQSEYQSFLKAQQRKQYLLLGELNFLHSVHCHSSYKDKCSQLVLTQWKT